MTDRDLHQAARQGLALFKLFEHIEPSLAALARAEAADELATKAETRQHEAEAAADAAQARRLQADADVAAMVQAATTEADDIRAHARAEADALMAVARHDADVVVAGALRTAEAERAAADQVVHRARREAEAYRRREPFTFCRCSSAQRLEWCVGHGRFECPDCIESLHAVTTLHPVEAVTHD